MVSFNRLLALATAVFKRFGLCMCAAYFDDLITLESVNSRASARPFLLLVLTALGAPPSPVKSIPLRQHRAWLGAVLNLATVKMTCTLPCKPKEVIQGCHLAIARGSFTPAEASTLRGQAGWTATLSAGRFGRIGMRVLKERQYQSPYVRCSLDKHNVQELHFWSSVFSVAPPLLCILADLPVFLIASIRMHPTQKECAPALNGGCLTTMLSLLWVTGTTSLRFCCTTGSSHIPSWQQKPFPSFAAIWQHRDVLTGRDVIFFTTPSCRQRHDQG